MKRLFLIFSIFLNCAFVNLVKPRLPPPEITKNGVIFRFYAPSAKYVTLAGDFNGWGGTSTGRYDPSIDRMRDDGMEGDEKANDGVWTIVKKLPPGVYQYKFVVDGLNWYIDPGNPETIQSGGYTNSVVRVR
uniref:AMP-activated protein kinase glycogen-binding domain-containing protein n=1 Tax=candidate division WOR-3 bacterium TaxID=2052148 RepID=A0A7C4Y538_UNCW3